MRTIPILFSTPMVQALLDGRKTQTRRVVKPQSNQRDWLTDSLLNSATITLIGNSNSNGFGVQLGHPLGGPLAFINCPYGQPGDVLWVRETWAPIMDINDRKLLPDTYCFAADLDGSPVAWDWKPNIHMPKKACRLFLKVKSVRVERLQEISQNDCVSEGIEQLLMSRMQLASAGSKRWRNYSKKPELFNEAVKPYQSFCTLWQSINGPESWDANPWVWVVEFERTEKPQNFC